MVTSAPPFTVAAGKYDGEERNCKYCEDFKTFEEAFAAYIQRTDYPWCDMEYVDPEGRRFCISPYNLG